MSNEDELFYRNLSSNKVEDDNKQEMDKNTGPQIVIQNQSQLARAAAEQRHQN